MKINKTLPLLYILTICLTFFNCSKDEDSVILPVFQAKVFEGDVILSSQDEVDAFGEQGYNEITGFLYIGVNNPNAPTQTTDIDNLGALSSISSVQNGLIVYNNPGLQNLEGLNSLTFINGGPLEIRLNENLTSINALGNLLSFKSLYVEENPMLLNLDGLNNVHSGRDGIIVKDNLSLSNLNGLSGITTVGGEYLFISGNTELSNISGLNNIIVIEGDLFINKTKSTTLSLGNLEQVNGNVFISFNEMLTNLNVLENLEQVGGNISISANSTLTNFCGLMPLIDAGGLSGGFSTTLNEYNPTIEDMNAGDCSL